MGKMVQMWGKCVCGGKKVWGKKEGERKKKEGRNKKEGWRVNGGRGIVGRYVTCVLVQGKTMGFTWMKPCLTLRSPWGTSRLGQPERVQG